MPSKSPAAPGRSRDWSELEVAWENADLALADLSRNLERVSVGLSGLDETHVAGLDTLVMEVSSSTGDIGEVREKLKSFVAQPEDNCIYWVTQDNRAGEIALNAAPLEVGELLQERLFSQKESVVLTSATMSTQGNFRHISERLGLEGRGRAAGGLAIRLPQVRPAVPARGHARSQQRAAIGEHCSRR